MGSDFKSTPVCYVNILLHCNVVPADLVTDPIGLSLLWREELDMEWGGGRTGLHHHVAVISDHWQPQGTLGLGSFRAWTTVTPHHLQPKLSALTGGSSDLQACDGQILLKVLPDTSLRPPPSVRPLSPSTP